MATMDKTYMRNFTYIGILLVLLVLSFILLKPILMSIITGIILASIFVPLYKRLNKIINHKNLSTAIISVLLLVIFVIPLIFLTPVLLNQSIHVYTASQNIDFITPLKNMFPTLFTSQQFTNNIGSVISSFVTKITNSFMNMISKLILNFPTIFLQMLVTFFIFFFVVRDHDKLIKYIQSIMPFPKKVEEKLFKSTRDITLSVLYGQIVMGTVEGIIGGISFYIFGVGNPLFLMLLASIAGIFPIIGTTIVWVPVTIFLFIKGNFLSAIGVLAFGLIAVFIENAVKPAFVSKRTNVHSAVILLGMVGGLFAFGLLGFILGPLILAYLLIILELFRDKRGPTFLIQEPEQGIDIKTEKS